MPVLLPMSFWTVLSWLGVAILSGINVFIFLKLKKAAEQMLSVAFPGAKNMSEAMARMQAQMKQPGHEAQLRQAMAMLQNKGRKR
ncbi:MAG: hypothetical protein ACK5QT_07700 [Oligoflexia bacterium]|jgi:hypothetical protein